MKIDLELSEEAEARIRKQAEMRGQDVSGYALELIERWLVRQENNKSGSERASNQ